MRVRDDYSPLAKALHWVTVLFVVAAWALGIFNDEVTQPLGLLTHIWVGLSILVLAAARIPWRIANPPPKVVSTEFGRWLIEWTDPVSRVMHYVLYGLLLAVPFFGIALQFANGHSLPLFGLGEIASPWPADKALAHNLKEVHEVLANLLVILATVHMTAALVHHVVFGDNTLKRMLPAFSKRTERGAQ
ncbi:cytochrome b [Bradyrhizobium sp. C9]|uniref:cytochrome b n=1 Tax=Bradyrhizobium sp. C9 TaxID=142585 RepID=UPI000BE7FFC2|nr:cytochrome b [Bradyrhizobium sp. C9]PDT73882.1 cytochrome B [Bradyrhizobium sp. C9]